MGCLERDLSLFNLPIEAQQWTLDARKSDKWFRREEAAGQYAKRWFIIREKKKGATTTSA